MFIGIGLIWIVAIIAIARSIAGSRRVARREALRADLPAALPAPVAMIWIPTARRSSSHGVHDAYGALAPGALEDRDARRR